MENIVNPPGYDTVNNYLGHKHLWQEHELTYRGYAKNINSYMNPWTAADPGQPQVTGKISLGFNLDHNAKTGGFNSPAGEKGVDNGLYRAWGCIQASFLAAKPTSVSRMGLFERREARASRSAA